MSSVYATRPIEWFSPAAARCDRRRVQFNAVESKSDVSFDLIELPTGQHVKYKFWSGIFMVALSVALFCRASTAASEDLASLSFNQKLKLAQAEWYRKAADQGNIEAQFKLARILSEGLPGLKKNLELAAKLYESAARQGHPEAQNWLGYSYQHGLGVAQSDASAIQWYRKAADSGLAVAQNNLGLMFLNGKGVPRDYAQAFSLFEQAAKKGNRDAGRNLKRLSANKDWSPSAGPTQSEGKPVDAKAKPPIVEKTKVHEANETAGEPATSAIDKPKSITNEAVLPAPPLPRSKPKSLARQSLAPRLSKSANEPEGEQWGDFWRDLISRRPQ